MGKYEESLKVFRDLNNVIDTAEWKGRKEEKRTIARDMKSLVLSGIDIQKVTGGGKRY